MNRLIGYIERLLFQHDCVIIPEFGGFVLQTVPAVYSGSEHLFMPVRKEIVFNPSLKHNDGLLAEAYMQDAAVGYEDAQQLVNADIASLRKQIDDATEFRMGVVGAFVKDKEKVVYKPENHSDTMFSVSSYGLPAFHYLPLSAWQADEQSNLPERTSHAHTAPHDSGRMQEPERKRDSNVVFRIPLTRTFLRTVGIAAAAIACFFLASTPVKDVSSNSYTAGFVPEELIPKKTIDDKVTNAFNPEIESKEEVSAAVVTDSSSLSGSVSASASASASSSAPASSTEVVPAPSSEVVTTEVVTAEIASESSKASAREATSSATGETDASAATVAKPNAASVSSSAATFAAKPYFVIIGSFANREQANAYIKQLKGDVKSTAGVLVRDKRVRVYSQHFANEAEAQRHIEQLQKNPRHRQAWLYVFK